jgi:hypothetical protein
MFAFAFVGIAAGGGPQVTLAASYTVDSVNNPSATATFTLESDGDIISDVNGSPPVDEGDWLSPKASAPGSFECRMVTVSGTVSTGTVDSWLALSSDRTWTVSASGTTKSFTGTLEIREGSGSVLDSATVTLSADGS